MLIMTSLHLEYTNTDRFANIPNEKKLPPLYPILYA
jgi:hypothetical protein